MGTLHEFVSTMHRDGNSKCIEAVCSFVKSNRRWSLPNNFLSVDFISTVFLVLYFCVMAGNLVNEIICEVFEEKGQREREHQKSQSYLTTEKTFFFGTYIVLLKHM